MEATDTWVDPAMAIQEPVARASAAAADLITASTGRLAVAFTARLVADITAAPEVSTVVVDSMAAAVADTVNSRAYMPMIWYPQST